MGAYNWTEACEVVGLFLLNNFSNEFDKISIGLYKDNGFAILKNINDRRRDKIRKEFHQIF